MSREALAAGRGKQPAASALRLTRHRNQHKWRRAEKLRKTIRATAPKAEECINYGLAAFRLHGKNLVAIGATAKHCAFYLMSGSTVDDHKVALQDYNTSQGTIRFPADKPLPAALVRKLVKARIAENG